MNLSCLAVVLHSSHNHCVAETGRMQSWLERAACQDLPLQPIASLTDVTGWNPLNEPTMAAWLAPEATEEDDQRLHCCGNIAIPQCGELAALVLHHLLKGVP